MQFTTLSSDGSHALTPWDAAANDFGMLVNEVVEPVKEYNPYLSWMTGKLPTSDRQMPVGWHVHKGVNPRLDALLTRLGYKHHLIEHENDQGEVELVDYWALNYRWDGSKGPRGEYVLVPVSLFVVARGVRDKREMKHPQDRDGVAYGWEVNRDKKQQIIYKPNGEPKKTAKLKMRAYIRELLPSPEQTWDDANGFLTWFQISVSGYLVDDALMMLYSQYRAMRAYDQRVQARGKTGVKTPYWALANPTVPAEVPRRVQSKEQEGQSTTIIPIRSLIPAEQAITDEFLLQNKITPALQHQLLQEDVLLETWQWSRDESEYLEGVKPRPTSNRASEDAVTVSGSVVREEAPTAPVQATLPAIADPDPCLDQGQVTVLTMLCGNDARRIRTLCQEYGVQELAHLRLSQFRAILGRVSQG